MKYLIGLAVILAGAYFYPQIATSTGGPCQALESKIVDEIPTGNTPMAMFTGILAGISNGEIGKALVADEYPNLPEPLGCAIGYYTFDKNDIEF